MKTEEARAFAELIEGLTPLQLDWVAHRLESKSDREASRRLGINKDTPGNWKAEGVPLDEIVLTAKQDGVVLVRRRILADLNAAYDVKRAGLKSRNEKIRQDVSTEILDRGIGKATQKQEISGPDGGPQEVILRWPDGRIAEPP